MKILVVDDDQSICKTLELYLSEHHEVRSVGSVQEFDSVWGTFTPDLLLLDLKLPDGNGLQLLQAIRSQGFDNPVIMITGHSDMESPIEAMRMGATDYIKKPLDIDEIEVALTRVQSHFIHKKTLLEIDSGVGHYLREKIVGHGREITQVLKEIGIVSKGKFNVLLMGESGTGKELVARTIHMYSSPEGPFVAVNCSALSPTLIESELFGHEKGAFTHAIERRVGRFEAAQEGTLFLDEIAELSSELQVKLLRVIQERKFVRVGSNIDQPFRARIISATNKDVEQMVQQKQFREDFYFRLCTHTIRIPPLRERVEDIPELVEYIAQKVNCELHKKITKVPEDAIKMLQQYSWPGNVRELENILMRSSLLSSGEILEVPPHLLPQVTPPQSPQIELCTLAEVERRHIETILRHVQGNITHASAILGITRPTLRKKIVDYQIATNFAKNMR